MNWLYVQIYTYYIHTYIYTYIKKIYKLTPDHIYTNNYIKKYKYKQILLSRFDIKMYQIMSSKLFAYFFTILAIIQLMFVAVEHCGWGLLSKNPDKYMWSFEILAPAEFVILSLYYIEFCFKSKIYKKIHPWLVTYGIITFVSIIDLIVASSSIDEDPRTVMRITRALRPFFLFHRWRPLRNMIHEIVTSIKKLIPVLIIALILVNSSVNIIINTNG